MNNQRKDSYGEDLGDELTPLKLANDWHLSRHTRFAPYQRCGSVAAGQERATADGSGLPPSTAPAGLS